MRLLAFSLLLLAGCAHKQPGIEIQYVDRPVIQVEKCIERKDVPVTPARIGALPDELDTALAFSLAKISEWIRYGQRADLVIKACSK